MNDESEDLRRVGRDEMNLAEFPIALLTDYPPEGVKMLVFEDRHGKLTVVGSEDRGLPTASDSDVIVGLLPAFGGGLPAFGGGFYRHSGEDSAPDYRHSGEDLPAFGGGF